MKFVYIVNSALSEINKNKAVHIMIVICVLVSTFFLSWVGIICEPAYYDMSTLLGFKNKDILFLQVELPEDLYLSDTEIERFYENLNTVDNIEIGVIEDIKLSFGKTIAQALVYGDIVAENTKLRLSSGIQLSEYKGCNIPAILSENHELFNRYEVGDIIESEVIYKVDGGSETVELKIEIVGKMAYPSRFYDEIGSAGRLISWDILNTENTEIIILPDFEIEPNVYYLKSGVIDFYNSTVFVEITAPKGSELYNLTYNKLREIGIVIPYNSMTYSSLMNYNEGMSDQLIVSVALLLLLTVGIGSANIYIGKSQVKNFSINFISGAKWTHCLMIDVVRNLIVITVPAVIGSTSSAIFFVSASAYDNMFNYGFFIVELVVVYMTLLFTISSLPYIIKLKNTEPITFIRTMNRE